MNASIATFTKDTIRRSFHKDFSDGKQNRIRTATKTATVAVATCREPKDDYDSSGSAETASDEIPVWIDGEQRWISGVNEETTCADLVNVLLEDEGVLCPGATNAIPKSFVITERWRRVEQVLDNDTKIQQIWSAWGHAKPEVKLTLRQIDPAMGSWSNSQNDQDSGMGSPTNSAIIRRRRHRASKTTAAWVTQAQTIHPKSQKGAIEKLMKLILEQGETIQQQLAKLRDREQQIAKIEEERHRMREREHGKNYLLETYLSGLHEAEEKEIVTVNSDSGVHTEGATSSPEVGIHENEDYDRMPERTTVDTIEVNRQQTHSMQRCDGAYKEKPSHREKKLLKDHKQIKEQNNARLERSDNSDNDAAKSSKELDENEEAAGAAAIENAGVENELKEKIEWLEKLVAINKSLVKEEELCVRLNAKIRRYQSDNPDLYEQQLLDQLARADDIIQNGEREIQHIELELKSYDEKLDEKRTLLEILSQELLVIEETERCSSEENPPTLPFNTEKLAENLYSYSQYIAKPNYEFNENNENRDHKLLLRQHTPDHVLNSQNSLPANSTNTMPMQVPTLNPLDQRIPPPAQYLDSTYPAHLALPHASTPAPASINHKVTPVPAPALNYRNPNPICAPKAMDSMTSMNLLQKPDPLKFNANVHSTSNSAEGLVAANKLGPKKLISGIPNEFESNSDTGLSSLGEDIIHAGTLV